MNSNVFVAVTVVKRHSDFRQIIAGQTFMATQCLPGTDSKQTSHVNIKDAFVPVSTAFVVNS